MAAIADHPISDLYFDETNSTVSPIFLPTTRGKSPFFLRRNRAKSSSPNLFLVPCWIGFVSKQIDSKFGSGYHVVRHEIEILLQFFISFFLIYYLVSPFLSSLFIDRFESEFSTMRTEVKFWIRYSNLFLFRWWTLCIEGNIDIFRQSNNYGYFTVNFAKRIVLV